MDLGRIILAGPVVLGGVLLNLPPLLAGAWAGWAFPDGRNVISLWRILVGIPVWILWGLLVTGAAAVMGAWRLAVLYPLLTAAALAGYRAVKHSVVAVYNTVRYSDLRPRYQGLLEELRRALGP
jgi:hypothetical protein